VKTKKKKIIAAMSGGVDSSVAAALMKEKGYDVIGVTLKLIDCESFSEKKKSCCGIDDRRQVIEVCKKLEIPHYFLDLREKFEKKVLLKCWENYSSGMTPNPCVLCNRYLKFGELLNFAHSVGADGIVTGHYAKILMSDDGSVLLFRGKDKTKDQSYFLSLVKSKDLSRTFTPLSEYDKVTVREIARKLELPNSEKRESQDVCIGLLGKNFAETLRLKFGKEAKSGFLMDEDGSILGKHNGIHNFTIGQRRGFGVGFGKPIFVTKIIPSKSEVILSFDESKLFSKIFRISQLNWLLADYSQKDSFYAEVQIRYRSKSAKATIKKVDNMEVIVEFNSAQRAITPGQTAVIYDGDCVIGGGIISSVID